MSNKNGFIYIMSNPVFADGRIKVGKSKSDPSSFRKDELYSTGVPEPFQIEYFAFVENYDSVELEVHRRLNENRPNKNREFFTATITEAINAIREISKIKYEEDFSDSSLRSSAKVNEKFYSDNQTVHTRSFNFLGPGDGFQEWFWSNGQLRERINYKNGDMHGISEFFDSFGNKSWTKTYRNGKLNGPAEYYHASKCDQTHKLEKDRLLSRGNYKEDPAMGADPERSADGLWEWFYENGQISTRGNYKQYPSCKGNPFGGDEKEGLWESFYENGQLKIKANFIKGELDGDYEEFDEDGTLTKTKTYRKGEEVL
tara:strand:- start:310 stop:1251 length:942 start_codon:yes stop_codon:yes gene_type:complete